MQSKAEALDTDGLEAHVRGISAVMAEGVV